MKSLLIAITLLAMPSMAAAQNNVVPANHLAWDQEAGDLASAQAFTYKVYGDTSTVGNVLNGVTCDNSPGTTSIFICQVVFPAFSPGFHSLAITTANSAGESLKSVAFPFFMIVTPAVPKNLRIQ